MHVKLLALIRLTIALTLCLCAVVPAWSAQRTDTGLPAQSQPNSEAPRVLTTREVQIEHAKILMATKRFEDAIQAYAELLKSEPKNAEYLNMTGIAYLNLSNPGQAKKYFERSAKADKTYSSAVNNLGMVWYHQKNYRRAIQEYQRAALIDPSQAGVYMNLGFAYYNSKKYTVAASEFRKALEIDPHALEHNDRAGSMTQDRSVINHGLFFFMMAREYAQLGDVANCVQYLRKSFDEGYQDVAKAKTDPAFKKVLGDPAVQGVLLLLQPGDPAARTSPPGA